MRETRIKNKVSSIPIGKLVPHPDNPNRMSKKNFAKLVRNIERTGRYEPLVVRPCPQREGFFQIINGHHRCQALAELGYETVDAMVWDIDDHEADMLLATINRLGGRDVLDKKLALLCRLNERTQARDLAKLLPLSCPQIERLTKISSDGLSRIKLAKPDFATPLVFFVNRRQQKIIESAMSLSREASGGKTKAQKNAAALTQVAAQFNLKSQNQSVQQ
jgi:ParB/RepB/Spo0J family partition protein